MGVLRSSFRDVQVNFLIFLELQIGKTIVANNPSRSFPRSFEHHELTSTELSNPLSKDVIEVLEHFPHIQPPSRVKVNIHRNLHRWFGGVPEEHLYLDFISRLVVLIHFAWLYLK